MNTDMQDAHIIALVRRAQMGDAGGIDGLYDFYHLRIYHYLFYKVGNRETAEDLTSEVFLRMIRGLPKYSLGNVSFQAWLYRIARNLVVDFYRKQNMRNHIPLDEDMLPRLEDPSQTVERGFTADGLVQALKKLPDEQRDVIVMRFISGMPIAEVAQVMEKSEDAIKGLQRRALFALRKMLTDGEISNVGRQ